jgi:hypothetical protein
MVHRNVRFSANGKRPTKKIHWNSQRKCCHLLLVPDVLKDLARENGLEVHPLDVVWVGFAARKQRSGQWRIVYFLDGLQTVYCFANQWGWMIVCLASVGEHPLTYPRYANIGFGDVLKCKRLEDQ